MLLSVVIPVFNERETLVELVARVRQAEAAGLRKEILLVDDGSTDGTRDLYPALADQVEAIILHDRNWGKGAAVRTGLQHATGDVVLVQDADLEYDPNDYPVLLDPLLRGVADVVYGSRFQGGGAHRVLLFWHSLGNRALTMLSNMLTNLNLTDMETCYKVFRREVLGRIELRENRFGFEPEVTARIAGLPDIRIYEVGISYHGRTYGEGKKVGWRDGVRALLCIAWYSPLSLRVRNHFRLRRRVPGEMLGPEVPHTHAARQPVASAPTT